MKRPIVVWHDKGPKLLRQTLFNGIALHVSNTRPDFLWRIQVHLPSTEGPNGMPLGYEAVNRKR